jgi:hypothetical protein
MRFPMYVIEARRSATPPVDYYYATNDTRTTGDRPLPAIVAVTKGSAMGPTLLGHYRD